MGERRDWCGSMWRSEKKKRPQHPGTNTGTWGTLTSARTAKLIEVKMDRGN